MKYSRSAITQLTRWYRQVLIKCAILNAAIIAGTFGAPSVAEATDINQNGVPFQTATTIENNNPHIWNISTTTTNGAGTVGLNTFGKFNVSEGDTANLNLINKQNKLVNLVFDSSASQIDGIVNSYKNGQIGGDVLFANPNGFVVGKTGVFNVGSLTLMTPTEDTMKKVFKDNAVVEKSLDALVSFNMGGTDYLLLGGEETEVELNPAEISIDGTINSGAGITIANGGKEININNGAELNANMDFNVSDGTVTATKKSNVTPTSGKRTTQTDIYGRTTTSIEYKLASDGGNGIAIVSKNQGKNDDYLAAIVNLNGKVDANGSDVIVQTETYSTGSRSAAQYNKASQQNVALSKVTVGGNGEVDGHNIALNARTIASKVNNDIADSGNEWYRWMDKPANFILDNMVHIADMKSSVEVLSGARLTATKDVSVNATTDFNASAKSIFETFAFSYTDLDVVTEAIVRSHANITAENLNVLSTTNIDFTMGAVVTNMVEMGFDVFDHSYGHGGAYAFSVSLLDVSNRAVIEKEVDLNIARDILIDAEMFRSYDMSTKQGWLPIVDRNFGAGSISIAAFIAHTVNEAIMESDVEIPGSLNVLANYIGRAEESVSASGTQKGKQGQAAFLGNIAKFFYDMFKMKLGYEVQTIYSRANGYFDKIKVSGAIGYSLDDVKNNAFIGNKTENIKPKIKAGNVAVEANLLDNKSMLAVQSAASKGATSVSGAVAVNLKDLSSNASAYGDFEIKGNSSDYIATQNNDYVLLPDGTKKTALNKGDKIHFDYTFTIYEATKDNVTEKEVNGVKKTYITLPDGNEIEGIIGDKVILPEAGLKISSETVVKHGLSHQTFYSDMGKYLSRLFNVTINGALHDIMDPLSGMDPKSRIKEIDTQDAGAYLGANKKAADIQKTIDDAGNMNFFNALGASLGLEYFFTTYANSTAWAASKDQETTGFAGSFAVAINNTVSKAILEDNSNVVFKSQNNNGNTLKVNAYTNDQVWSGSGNIDILNNIDEGMEGLGAVDGSAGGGALSFQWLSPETIATIGKNVEVTQDNSNYGDVVVKAYDETDDVNAAASNGNADETGIAGAISISAIVDGQVKASIESSASIKARDILVTADKDLTHVNGNLGISISQNSVSVGIGVNYAEDEVVSYIAGNVEALNDVIVNSDYDKLFVNGAFNMGFARAGTDMPKYGNISDEQREQNLDKAIELFDKAEEIKNTSKYFNNFRSLWNLRDAYTTFANADYDFTRPANPDKKTATKAGMASVSVSDTASRAYIADGARVLAGRDVKVNATSEDLLANAALILSVNGKSGMGGALIAQWTQNEVEAYIGNAVVDALREVDVNANEDIRMFTGSVGVAQGKDKSVAGNLSFELQNNEVTAAIKEGAKVNTNKDNAQQSVDVTAGVKSQIIKGVGTVSVQAGGNGNGGAKGGTLDGDIALNKINAYIKDAEVNAGKELNVKATNRTDLITVDAAGAVSTQGSSYAGTLGAYVSINEENAYIEDSQINTTTGRTNKNAKVDVVASSTFEDFAVVGTVAYGNQTSADGSVRVDGIGDEITSYIKDSFVDTSGDITLDNDSSYKYLSITAAGAISSGANAYSGAIAIAVNSAIQNNHIEGSTINSNKLALDSDAVFDTTAVTGVVTASTSGMSIGGSVYAAVIDNDIDNYIKNSNITAQSDIDITSDTDIDSLNVIFAGSGGSGLAASGAVSVVVNSADLNTYILSESADKKVQSANGKVNVKSKNDVNLETINGTINISIGAAAGGGAINVVVDSSDTTTGIEGTKIIAEGDVDVEATTDEDIMSISIGGAGGSGMTVAGSINTVVMASDTSAYIKNADVASNTGDIKVISSGDTEITGGTGSASISLGSFAALGASIITGVIDNEVKATIENSRAYAGKDVTVSATANETIGEKKKPFITLAGGFSQGVTVEGVIATLVMSSTADAHIIGTKNIDNVFYGVKAGRDVAISAEGKDTIYAAAGAAGASTVAGVGATVNTIVIDKDVKAYAQNAIIEATHDIKAQAKETDDFFTTVVAAAGGGVFGGAGAVNTNVITSKLDAGYENSSLKAENKISSNAEATANMQTITGSAAGGGAVGVGISAVNDIIRYTVESKATGGNAKFKELDVKSKADSTYEYETVSGAGGGTVGASGVENVNYVNNTIKAYADGVLEGDKAVVEALDKVTFVHPIAGFAAGGGAAGFGATVMVNSVTSTIDAYIGGNVQVKDIDVKAKGEQEYDHIVAVGFAGGGVAGVSGTVLVNDVDTFVHAYISDGAKVKADDVDIDAQNKITLTSFTGAAAGGGVAAFGASVDVNNFKSTTEAYTGDGVIIEAKNVDIKAKTETYLGKSDAANKMIVASGSFGLYAGIAGSVLWSGIENRTVAHVGSNNVITLADEGHLNLNATDISKIYESVGGGAGGAVGVGASVGGNEIHNTVLASIGTGTVVEGEKADVNISANSSETVDSFGIIVSGGIGALSGGAVYVHIGDKEDNASINNYENQSEEERKTLDGAQKQKDDMFKAAKDRNTSANEAYKKAYNDALGRIENQSRNTRLADKEQASGSLYDLANREVIGGTDRKGTAAFIDTAADLKIKNLNITAQNTNDIKLKSANGTGGAVGIGVSVAVAEDKTTTNAFVQNGVKIAADSVQISADSEDKHRLDSYAASGGIFSGNGSVAVLKSDKTTNAYVNDGAVINAVKNLNIGANSHSDNEAYAWSGSFGGVVVGMSIANAKSSGKTRIDLGDNVTLTSEDSDIIIKTDTNENTRAEAWAATGGVGGGGAALSTATSGKDNTVNIGKNFSAEAGGNFAVTSNAINNSDTESNGRAYGGVSTGGANGTSNIDQTSGVNIEDAETAKTIKADSVEISSKAVNDATSTVYAGAGAVLGISASKAKTDIKSTNKNYVGKNYDISTTEGGYSFAADTMNKYKSYVKSDSYGVITTAIPKIENIVDSTVTADSEADVTSSKNIVVRAANEIRKNAVSGYDLYGGAGGIAGGGGGSINDTLKMDTTVKFGGNKARAEGDFESGRIDISAYNIANINEKADLYAHGGIAGADTDSKVYLIADAKTEITNKDISNYDDDISYVARNDVDIYTKSNVESYGGVTGSGGDSIAQSSKQHADVVISGEVKSKSGRNTNISALSNKSLEAHIYERTRGLASIISGDSYAYNKDSEASIDIQSGAQIKSYDSMNLTAYSSTQKLSATRDAIAYQLWGIPYRGKGNTHTEDKNSSSIIINGAVESGLGAYKHLVINKDGTYESENDAISVSRKEIGKITSADIQVDIDSYKASMKKLQDEHAIYVAGKENQRANHETNYNNAKTAKEQLKTENTELMTLKNSASALLEEISDAITEVTTPEGMGAIAEDDIVAYAEKYGSITEVQTWIEAYKAYVTNENEETQKACVQAWGNLVGKQETLLGQVND
ncbi:MAG: leukotoxin LktA family filamentous adhesin [Alphaproteobacteria bacterium]|nr:leukotoxin LktA family filamentous adhesin [Alphaproteobacteria bacterium]